MPASDPDPSLAANCSAGAGGSVGCSVPGTEGSGPLLARNERAVSTGRCNEEFVELLRWSHEPEGGAWTVVEAGSDSVEVFGAVDGQVGAFREVLSRY
jgi:hypothetical protein